MQFPKSLWKNRQHFEEGRLGFHLHHNSCLRWGWLPSQKKKIITSMKECIISPRTPRNLLRIYVKLDPLLHCYAVGSARTWAWPSSPSLGPSLTVPTADRMLPHVLELTADSCPTCCVLASSCNSQETEGSRGRKGRNRGWKPLDAWAPSCFALVGRPFWAGRGWGWGDPLSCFQTTLKTTAAQNKPGHCVPGYKYWFSVVLTFCS